MKVHKGIRFIIMNKLNYNSVYNLVYDFWANSPGEMLKALADLNNNSRPLTIRHKVELK